VEFLVRGAAFWPQDPILTGDRLCFPLGVDLLSAVFVQLGLSLRLVLPAMGLAGSAMAALALRRWGGALAVAGLLFAGGLSGFEALWTGRLVDYQSGVAWKNLFLALFVPQRGFLLALPTGLLLLWSGRERFLRGRVGLPAWVDGVLWGALPLVHLHTFVFVSVLLGTWAVAARRVRAALPALAVALVPATWGVVEVTGGFGAASLVGWAPGWVVGSENPAWFLLANFGLFLPLAIAALVVAARERRREDVLLLPPALVVLGALFVVRLAPWAWDNTKALVLPRGAAAHRLASDRPCAAGVASGGGDGSPLLRRGERHGRVSRPWVGPRDPQPRGVCGCLPGRPRASPRRPCGDGAHVQPPGGALRPAHRRGLSGPPLEPRCGSGRFVRAVGPGAPVPGSAGMTRGGAHPRGALRVLGRARTSGVRRIPTSVGGGETARRVGCVGRSVPDRVNDHQVE
jgi:hypothetical protein